MDKTLVKTEDWKKDFQELIVPEVHRYWRTLGYHALCAVSTRVLFFIKIEAGSKELTRGSFEWISKAVIFTTIITFIADVIVVVIR